MKNKCVYLLAGAVWIALAGWGFYKLSAYQTTAADFRPATLTFPQDASFQQSPGLPTLIIFVHPHCPCSRASIDSLAWLMTRMNGKVSAHAAFLLPKDFPESWEKTDMWRAASAIPGVTVYQDTEGRDANYFHAVTSGETLLYDAKGRLMFQGGITAARGHFGDNAGRSAILDFVSGRRSGRVQMFTFGCSLVTRMNGEKKPL